MKPKNLNSIENAPTDTYLRTRVILWMPRLVRASCFAWWSKGVHHACSKVWTAQKNARTIHSEPMQQSNGGNTRWSLSLQKKKQKQAPLHTCELRVRPCMAVVGTRHRARSIRMDGLAPSLPGPTYRIARWMRSSPRLQRTNSAQDRNVCSHAHILCKKKWWEHQLLDCYLLHVSMFCVVVGARRVLFLPRYSYVVRMSCMLYTSLIL